jgi:hypothetical protein
MSTAAQTAADSAIVQKGECNGCILVQYSTCNNVTSNNASSASTTTDQQSVFLVPQLQPETTGSNCLGTLSRSTIQLLATGGRGGDGANGGNGSGGVTGCPGQVRTWQSKAALQNDSRFQHYFAFPPPLRMRAILPGPPMEATVATVGTQATARRAPRVEQAVPLNFM